MAMNAPSPEPKTFIPPRGHWKSIAGTAPRATWMNPDRLKEPEWREGAGKIILGINDYGQTVAYNDDRHLITIAGSRAGKTRTMLIPNLHCYEGSVLVIDPKGELAEETAVQRAAMGQKVHILDPFGEVERNGTLRKIIDENGLKITDKSAVFNPIDELRLMKQHPDLLLGEAAAIADALIISNDRDPHWGDSARKLVQAVILYLLTDQSKLPAIIKRYPATLKTVVDFFASTETQADIFTGMSECDDYGGFLQAVASTNINRGGSKEYTSIISVGDSQISPLGDMYLGKLDSDLSDFSLTDLKKKPTTIYLVLPAARMGTHARWLRMMITLALSAFERKTPTPKPEENETTEPKPPVLFVLEEFAALGYMRPIERAAGYIAGFGVKLWPVLQDLQQLKCHYRDSWQTFLGNAGMMQVFGLNDGTTEEFISERLGVTQYEDDEPINHNSFEARRVDTPKARRVGRLFEPHEVRMFFAREKQRQIIMFPHLPPIALTRLPYGN